MDSLAPGLLGAFLLLAGAWGIGSLLTSRVAHENPLPISWTLLLGLGTLATLVYVTAAFGTYDPRWAIPLLALTALHGILVATRARFRMAPDALPWEALPGLLALIATLTVPVVFWDCLAYHLAIPEFIHHTGHLVNEPSYVFGFYPQAMECLYTLCVPFGEVAARIVNMVIMVVAALAALESIPQSEATARRIALALLLTMPGILLLMYVPKNSSLLALSGVVAFEAALRTNATTTARTEAAWICGAALGIALATHYGSLWLLPFLLPFVLVRGGISSATRVVVGALPFALPVYLRNAAVAGNPLYPFLSSLFGTTAPAFIQSASLPSILVVVERLSIQPWIGFEALGIGSTFGIGLPTGLFLAWLYRRDTSYRDIVPRIITGLGLFAIATSFYGLARFGIAGIFLLAPLAAHGLSRWPRSALILLLIHSMASVTVLVSGPIQPLDAFREGPKAYRDRFDSTRVLARFAERELPASAKIASVAILRPYGWGCRLEPAGEDYPPAIAQALQDPDPAAALRARGFTHVAVDFSEWARLRTQYHYLDLSPPEQSRFERLLMESHLLAANGTRTALFAL